MNRRNWEALAIIVGLITTLGVTGWIINQEWKKANLEIKPSCYEIEVNDEWYYDHGHADWVQECRK